MKLKRGISLLISLVTFAALTFSLPQPAYTAKKKKLTRRPKTTRALSSKKEEAQKIQKEIAKKKERVKKVIKKEESTLSMIENIDTLLEEAS